MRDLLLEKANPCFHAHIWALRFNPAKYVATIQDVEETGAISDISGAVKARVLAALQSCAQHDAIQSFLRHCEATDIAKALTLLDRPREARQLRQKIQQIENQNPHLIITNCEETCVGTSKTGDSSTEPKKRPTKRKIDVHRKRLRLLEAEHQQGHCQSLWCNHHPAIHLDSAVQEQAESTSVSGALARKVRTWAKEHLKADFLEFVLLSLPLEPWRKLADLVHFAPRDFAVPYFLADVFGKEIPQDCFVAQMRSLTNLKDFKGLASAFLSLVERFPTQVRRQYSYLRNQSSLLRHPAIVECLANTIPLETLLWYFEELYQSSPKCATILQERLHREEDSLAESMHSRKSKATYGKLVERILKLRRMSLGRIADDLVPLADRRLRELKQLHSSSKALRVAVFGDASASMEAAIEAATIFASMVSTCLDGELSFFNHFLVPSPHPKPQNVEETLQVCSKIRARNCTSLAAALWPYLDKGKAMDLFIMVTDEEENTSSRGYRFADLLARYKEKVNSNAELIVVSVGPGDPGFRDSLLQNGIEYKTVTIDQNRADLTKFDRLLAQLAAISSLVSVEDSHSTIESPEKSHEDPSEDFVLV